MTHQELLAQYYQAYKNDDWEYARILQDKFPDLSQGILSLLELAKSAEEFNKLLEDETK